MSHSFKREEEKFIIESPIADKIQETVNEFLPFSEFNKGGLFIDIRTTYMESHDYYIYHLKKTKKKKRFKIRFREYGVDGVFQSFVWVELKEKVKGQGYKNRFIMDKKDVGDFIKGKNIFDKIISYNRKIDPSYLRVLFDMIQKLIRKNELYPRLVIQYQRLALQNGLKGSIRLTFDKNIKSSWISEDQLFKTLINPICFDPEKTIIELKTGSTYPDLVNQIKAKYNMKKRKFSKFMFGMSVQCFSFGEVPESVDVIYKPISELVTKRVTYAV